MIYDCIVIGAGPAGGSTAYHLARRGRSVLVLDKAELPRYKPCGGGVSPVVANWFDFDFDPVISHVGRSFRYTWQGGDVLEVENEGPPMWLVRRDTFDAHIIAQATAHGAEIEDGVEVTGIERESGRWTVRTAAGERKANFLVAADGSKGRTIRWLGLEPKKRALFGAIEAEAPVDVDPNEPVHIDFGSIKNGYLWNFPKADGYSLGAGTFRGTRGQSLKGALDEYAARFGVELSSVPQWGHPISVWNGDRVLHTEGAVVAGEAAGVVDPFTAEGIRPSILTGIIAAEQIDAALAGESGALERYSERVAQEWGADMRWAKRVGELFYRFARMAYTKGLSRPSATSLMMRILAGDAKYGDVFEKAKKRLFG